MSLSVDQSLRKAERHVRHGELDLATERYKGILETYPKNRRAIEGLKALRQPRRRTAVTDTGSIRHKIDQLISLYNQSRFEETRAQGEALAKQFPNVPIILNLLGAANAGLGHLEEAVANYSSALQAKPDYAEAHNNLANVLKDLGKRDEAIASFERALQIKPDYAEAHRNLSTIKKYRDGDPQIQLMLDLVLEQDLTDDDRIHLTFALGKAFDDIGNPHKAFPYLLEGNRLHKEKLEFEISSSRVLFAEIKAAFSRKIPALNIADEPAAAISMQPVFILLTAWPSSLSSPAP